MRVPVMIATMLLTPAVRAEPLPLQEALSAALAASPQVLEARAQLEGARARARVAGYLLPENPEIEAGYVTDAPFANEGEGEFEVGLSQRFEISGARGARIEAAEADIAAARASLANAEAVVRGAIASSWYELAALEQRAAVLEAASAQAQQLAEAARLRFEKGDIAEAESTLLQAEAAQVAAEADRGLAERAEAQARLNVALGRAAGADVRTSEPAGPAAANDASALPDLPTLVERARRQRADLEAARRDVEARASEIDARRRERFPEPLLFVGYSRERSVIESFTDTDDLLGVRLTLPLPFVRTGTAEVAEAEAARTAAEARRAALERDVETQVAALRARAEAASRQVARYAELEASVARTDALYERGYSEGRISLADFLAVRDRIRAVRLGAIEAWREAKLSGVTLETALGGAPAASVTP